MTHITPQQFAAAFLQAASAAETEIIARWDGPLRDYTSLMFTTVFPAIAPHLGVECYSGDYFLLDCIYYAERDIEHFSPNSYYAKYLSVSLEHENNIAGTAVEMNKLQLFNTPLKVLITYAHLPSERALFLERYAKIVRAADVFGDFATFRRQLVIFGSSREAAIDWHFFVYEESGFQEIQVAYALRSLGAN